MSLQQDNGRWGENLAENYLIRQGFQILHRNWRYKRAEVDIIAMEGDILVFVEVKSRASDAFGRPEEMVDYKKKRLLYSAASAYMYRAGFEGELRFDIIAIIGQPGLLKEILHFRDAFYPGMGGRDMC